ncbi:sortase [Patescibacteria group bacterium]|nr:sortase [Patescibacteria group bacterium]
MTTTFQPKLWLYRLADFLLIGGIGLLIFIFFPIANQEINYQIKKKSFERLEVINQPSQVDQAKQQDSFRFQPKMLVPISFDFSLVIPKIGINTPVFPNINSADPDEYQPILKKGVAHAQGSSLPNQPGPVFIFAHSTDAFYNISRYNAVFYLLPKLQTNDEVFIFYKNKKYQYQVLSQQVVKADEISALVNQTHDNVLILQTCWPPGTTLKRLIVITRQIK